MRKDFHKILCERPRIGDDPYDKDNYRRARDARVLLTDLDFEDFEPIERYHTFRSRTPTRRTGKLLNDYLSPLERYLLKQVGRPWNKVYSELMNAIPDGVHGDHVKSHLNSWVETKAVIIDGKAYGQAHYNRWIKNPGPEGRFEIDCDHLYVNPNDGLLKWGTGKSIGMGFGPNKAARHRSGYNRFYSNPAYKPEDTIPLNDDMSIHLKKKDGIWYYMEFIGMKRSFQTYRDEPAYSKRQLSKKELKFYGIENDATE